MNKFRYRSRKNTVYYEHIDNFRPQNVQTKADDFAEECLRSHNHFRTQHGCPPLRLSSKISTFSQQWADKIAREDHIHHSHHPLYGENLLVTYTSDISFPMIKGSQVVESWYSEHRFYPLDGFVTREIISKIGHFTQMIWSNSRELGIGKAISRNNRAYVVANYYPAGNILSKFMTNVPKKIIGRHYTKRLFSKMDLHHEFCIESWTRH